MGKMYKYYLRKSSTIDSNTEYYAMLGKDPGITTDMIEVNSVVNWNEMNIAWERHARYHGMFRKQSEKVQLAKSAATVARWINYTQGGLTAPCYFDIYVNDGSDNYSLMFSSKADFSGWEDYSSYVQFPLMQGDLSAMIIARDSTKYDIPITGTDVTTVWMDGIELATRYRYIIPPHQIILDNVPFFRLFPVNIFVRQEGDFTVGYADGNSQVFPAIEPLFFSADLQTEAQVNYDFVVSHKPTGITNGYTLRIEHWSGAPGTSTHIANYDIISTGKTAIGVTQLNSAKGTLNITMAAGESLQLSCVIADFSSTTSVEVNFADKIMYVNCTTYSVPQGDNYKSTKQIKGYRWYKALEKLLDKLTGGGYAIKSSFVNDPTVNDIQYADSKPYNHVLLSEQSLKQIYETPNLGLTLESMRQDAFATMMCGMGIEYDENGKEVLNVNHLSHYYDSTKEIGTLDIIGKPLFVQDSEFVLNKVQVGYEDYDGIDDINKLNEFNCKQEYEFGNVSVVDKENNTLNLITPFAASCNYIELTRAMMIDGNGRSRINNTQKKEAGKTFKVYIESYDSVKGGWLLDRAGAFQGVTYPGTIYNVRLSPKRNLQRALPYMRSAAALWSNKTLKFVSTEQNRTLSSSIGSGNVAETGNISLTGAALFLPYIMKFDAVVPRNLDLLMRDNSKGYFKVPYRGYMFYGYVKRISINKGTNASVSVELRLSPLTDVNNIINANIA